MERRNIYIFLLIFIFFCKTGFSEEKGSEIPKNQAEAIKLSGYTEEGVKKWDLTSETAEIHDRINAYVKKFLHIESLTTITVFHAPVGMENNMNPHGWQGA